MPLTTLIETDRLIMREFTLDDIDAVFNFSTCIETTRYTGDAGFVKTKADAKKVISDIWLAEYKKYGYARYALVHKSDQKVIGFCGVKFETRLNCPDIGYRMLPEYWGVGLGSEAVKALLIYARETLKLDKIVGEVVVENIASNKLLVKLGFKLLKTYPKNGFMINLYQ